MQRDISRIPRDVFRWATSRGFFIDIAHRQNNMKQSFRTTSITLLLLFVSGLSLIFFLPYPSLQHMHDSKAVYDDEHRLMRLTLSQDDKYRLFTPLSEISPTFISTTLLQEDQYFWWHPGFNPFALGKAVWETYVNKNRRMGASTITMQLARMVLKINSKTLPGKLQQLLGALQLEMHYTKKQILEAYLNLAPYGHNIEGIGAASLIYFNHDAGHLSLPESLSLSVIPQNPSKRIPSFDKLQQVREKLFNRWQALHPKENTQQNLVALSLKMREREALPFQSPHVVNHLLDNASDGNHQIQSTIHPQFQAAAFRVLKQYIARHANLGVSNGALMLVDVRDMSVKVSIGSVDFFNPRIQGQIDGTNIPRSPGSTLKPFIYGLALDQGLIHPNTILKDTPHQFAHYNPENFDYDFMGPVKAKDALILSRNIPAIYLQSHLSPTLYQLLEQAQIRHLKNASYYGLSLALGSVEMSMSELTGLYAMLLNEGVWRPLRFRKDEKLTRSIRLLSPEASFLILDILKDTPRPQGRVVLPALQVSWKTGTSSGYRDAWTVGTFGPYVLSVWIGNFNNQGNPAFIGKKLASPLFFELIDAFLHEQHPLPQLKSNTAHLNLERIPVCKASGLLPTRYCHDTEDTWFIPGKSPIKSDNIFREVAIDPKTGLRTCHIDARTQFKIFEFWPTDLLKIYKQAGIQPHSPPPYTPGCNLTNLKGISPQINSPQSGLKYIINVHTSQYASIPLLAITDADVSTIYWFINEAFLSQTSPNKPLLWQAKPGKFVVRVVDDHGRADAKDIVVKVEG